MDTHGWREETGSIDAARTVRVARAILVVLLLALGLAACATANGGRGAGPAASVEENHAHGTQAPYQVDGRWYYPRAQPSYDETGMASWYGAKFHNRRTADGEIFDQNAPSAAHTTLPLPSIVEVTNLANGRRLRVRLNDRGPFAGGRILDLSRAAAVELGFEREGLTRVRVRYVGPALASGAALIDAPLIIAKARPDPVSIDDEASTPSPSSPMTRETTRPTSVFSHPMPAPPADPTPYAVQVGAFQTRENAERAAAQLAPAGPTSIQSVPSSGGEAYRVVVGGFADTRSARAALAWAANAGFASARLIGAD